jgi:A/G-specific adenine glycosylase
MKQEIICLQRWFSANKRSFPWREEISPYRVWISEVMLQQTRAAVVIGYFNRWMDLFPSIESLAKAPLEAIIKAWEGLGYYSRARSIHKAAKIICEEHDGKLPENAAILQSLPGFGPYTTGAVCSFAFKQRLVAVDGNVLRVLSRYFAIDDDIAKAAAQKKIREKAEEFLISDESWITAEALIELGATLCAKKPKCGICPLKNSCQAYKKGVAEDLPYKSGKKAINQLYRLVALFYCDGHIAVNRVGQGIMASLFEFPYLSLEKGLEDIEEAKIAAEAHWSCKISRVEKLPKQKHSFTQFKADLYPFLFHCQKKPEFDALWFPVKELSSLPFSSGHRRILHAISGKLT